MDVIKERIKYIGENLEHEATATNVMRHILKVIRMEYETVSKTKGEGQSLHQIVTASESSAQNYQDKPANLKSSLLAYLSEYKVELETSTEEIATQASEHIHTKEIILTVGKSNTVEKFLKSAAASRSFNVIVVEAAPGYYVRLSNDIY